MFDDGIGPIGFAAGDVRTALEANGYSVTLAPLGDPSVATQSVRVILTTEAAVIPGKPATTGLSSQGYAIQRVADGAATNWWVIGKDAPGAMYGGLELAEAVKLEPEPGKRDQSPDQSVSRQPRDQVQHPAGRAHAHLYRENFSRPDDFIPLQCYRDVEHGFLEPVSRSDGPPSLQYALVVEREPVSVPGPGARVSEHGARRRSGPGIQPDQFDLVHRDAHRR